MNTNSATINNTNVVAVEAAASLDVLVAERDELEAHFAATNAPAWERELLLGDLEDAIYWTLVAQHNALRGV